MTLSPRLVVLAVVLLFVAIDVRIVAAVLGSQPLAVDWSPLWAAARLPGAETGSLYDFARITRAQAPLIGIVDGVRPFVYPPSALAVFLPFALLPVLPSYLAWIAATGAFYLVAAARLTRRWWLLPLTPPVLLAALIGQTSFLLGGLLLTGLHLLEKRPACAGLLLGIATAIKPQLFILVPLALVVARSWRGLFWWGAGGAAMVVASLALVGPGAWSEWLAALPRFQALVEGNAELVGNAITPYALAQRAGYAGWWVFAVAALPASAAVWATFRRDADVADRLVALVGGALLVSPYALSYELAVLAPALVAKAATRRGAGLLLAVGLSVPLGLGAWGNALALLSLAKGLLARQLRHAALAFGAAACKARLWRRRSDATWRSPAGGSPAG